MLLIYFHLFHWHFSFFGSLKNRTKIFVSYIGIEIVYSVFLKGFLFENILKFIALIEFMQTQILIFFPEPEG
jgi:hypothetical protein